MTSLRSLLITALISLTSLSAHATGETPVFASCYGANGALLALMFDTDQTNFTYRYEKAGAVDSFESAPTPFGAPNSSVTKLMDAQHDHIELRAQIITGDAIQPIIDTHAEVIFDRDATGSLVISNYSLFHLSQAKDLNEFKTGQCYVQ